MTERSNIRRNKASSLLSKENNEKIFSLLKPRCLTVATTVVRSRVIHTQTGLVWIKKIQEVLCLIKDYSQRNFYFHLYSLKNNCLVWEKMLTDVYYIGLPNIFYSLESTDSLLDFEFISDQEATEMKYIVENKLLQKHKYDTNKMLEKRDDSTRTPPKKPTKSIKLFSRKPNKTVSKLDISAPVAVRRINSFTPQMRHLFESPAEAEEPLIGTHKIIPEIIKQFGGTEEFSKSMNVNHILSSSTELDFSQLENENNLTNTIERSASTTKEALQNLLHYGGENGHIIDTPIFKTYLKTNLRYRALFDDYSYDDNDDEATRLFILNFIKENSNPVKLDRRKLLPPPPRPPPIYKNEAANSQTSFSPELQNSEVSSLDKMIIEGKEETTVAILENEVEIVGLGRLSVESAEYNNLLGLLKSALKSRAQAFHSDDSGE